MKFLKAHLDWCVQCAACSKAWAKTDAPEYFRISIKTLTGLSDMHSCDQCGSFIAEWSCEYPPLYRKCLVIDLGSGDDNFTFHIYPVTDEMVEIYTGECYFGRKIWWNSVNGQAKWNNFEKTLIISAGSICGLIQYSGTDKSHNVFLFPLTRQAYHSNTGGYCSSSFKNFAFATRAVRGLTFYIILSIGRDEGKNRIYEAAIGGRNAYTVTEAILHHFAGDENGKLKQAGSGEGGTVLRDKKILALVVKRETSMESKTFLPTLGYCGKSAADSAVKSGRTTTNLFSYTQWAPLTSTLS